MMAAAERTMELINPALRSGGLVPTSSSVAWVRAESVRGLVVYELDQSEHERRRRVGLGAVTSVSWLDVLMGMPLDAAVNARALTAPERRELRRLPPGCVEIRGGSVVRLLSVPLQLHAAVVEDSQWRRGLDRAGAYTGTARVLVLPRRPPDLDEAAMQAGYWGIALIVASGTSDEPEVVVAPQPFQPRAHTAALWQFFERIYSQIEAAPAGTAMPTLQPIPAAATGLGKRPADLQCCRTPRG